MTQPPHNPSQALSEADEKLIREAASADRRGATYVGGFGPALTHQEIYEQGRQSVEFGFVRGAKWGVLHERARIRLSLEGDEGNEFAYVTALKEQLADERRRAEGLVQVVEECIREFELMKDAGYGIGARDSWVARLSAYREGK